MENKTQIRFAVTAQLIRNFVFAAKYLPSSSVIHLLWLQSPVCVWPGRKLWRQVLSWRGVLMSGSKLWGLYSVGDWKLIAKYSLFLQLSWGSDCVDVQHSICAYSQKLFSHGVTHMANQNLKDIQTDTSRRLNAIMFYLHFFNFLSVIYHWNRNEVFYLLIRSDVAYLGCVDI